MKLYPLLFPSRKGLVPKEGGAFIKFTEGRWWEVDLKAAREKVSSVFRDFLHDKYRSSSKSKMAKRKDMRLSGKEPKTNRRKRSAQKRSAFQISLEEEYCDIPILPSSGGRESMIKKCFLESDFLPPNLPQWGEEADDTTGSCMLMLTAVSSNSSLVSLDDVISPLTDDDTISEIDDSSFF